MPDLPVLILTFQCHHMVEGLYGIQCPTFLRSLPAQAPWFDQGTLELEAFSAVDVGAEAMSRTFFLKIPVLHVEALAGYFSNCSLLFNCMYCQLRWGFQSIIAMWLQRKLFIEMIMLYF